MGIHELHVWQLAGDRIIATVHIKYVHIFSLLYAVHLVKSCIMSFHFCRCRTLEEYFYIAEKVKAVFHNEGIHSTTIQPEFCEVNF